MHRFLLIAAALASAGCTSQAQQADAPMTREAVAGAARAGMAFIANDAVTARQAANPDLLLIDVRTEAEYEAGRIPGATWMPRGTVEFRVAETVREADREIIVYCATGTRAALVQKALAAQGYTRVAAHAGFDTWAGAGQPVETDYGTFRLIAPAEKD